MENATKALYIATGVLIGILLLSVLVFVFSSGGRFWESRDNVSQSQEIENFNSKLSIYTGDARNTIFDVITVCNMAYDINKQNEYDNENNLTVEIENLSDKYFIDIDSNLKKGQIKKGFLANTIPITELIKENMVGETNSVDHFEITPVNTSGKYSYIFEGKSEFNPKTGKICKIVFECKKNT